MSDEVSAARVLLRPRWIAGHITVVVVAAIFVSLGFWQLARNDEKRDGEQAARVAFAAPAPALGDPDSPPPSGTRVEVTGTYDAAGEVFLRNRVRGGNGGYDVLTPLHMADGTAVVVDRGWVARNVAETGRGSLAPPTGTVTVRGPISEPRALQADDTVDEHGGRTTLPRVDLDRIGQDVSSPLRNVYVTAQWQDPAPVSDGPALPDPPEADDVNHLSYTFQWFAFALIPLVGWPIVLYRVTRHDQTKTPRNTAPATVP